MGYELQAIIGKEDVLRDFAHPYRFASVCPLSFGFALIPVSDEFLDEIGTGFLTGYYKLTSSLADLLCQLSVSGPIAYIEAEYFGGIGSQSAAVWNDQEQLLKSAETSDAINCALAQLGIATGASRDEFETLGLQRHRHTEDWLNRTD